MSFRLAAYAVRIDDERVLLARQVSPTGESTWSLPGGQVEHAEDPFDAVIREVAEETGCDYRVRITGGKLRPEPNGDVAGSVWTLIAEVAHLRRSSLVDTGIELARTVPATGRVAPVPVGGLVQH